MNEFIGQRLRAARNFHGFSLEEVGEKVCATRQYIQSIETNSDKRPSDEMVRALADVLEVEPSFFYKPDNHSIADDQCHFRKLYTTSLSIKNQALARGALFAELTDLLKKIVRFPPVDLPFSHTPKSLTEIEEIAEATRKHWKLGITGPIKNVTRVAENAGILITQFQGISEKIDAFSMSRSRPFIIRNPAKVSTCRMRFDIAHEIGHLIMHIGLHTGDHKTEDEANRFASAFLFPRQVFLKEFPRTPRISWAQIYNQKLRWKMSAAAIIRRAYDLGIIDAAQYRTAYIHLRKTGESKSERYDDRTDLIPLEEPAAISNAFRLLESKAPQKIGDLLNQFGIKKSFLEKLINQEIQVSFKNVVQFKRGVN